MKVLLDHRADINKCAKDGSSPLYIASQNGHDKCVKVLVDHGADVNKCDNEGASPLHIACASAHLSISLLLVKTGADIQGKEKTGHTPLYLYAQGETVNPLSSEERECHIDTITKAYVGEQKGRRRLLFLQFLIGSGYRQTAKRPAPRVDLPKEGRSVLTNEGLIRGIAAFI
jgi:hypothetical protein